MAEAILMFISNYGYVAVFVLMVLENIFPPIPSEVILPFVGYSAAMGQLNFVLALCVATLGALVGTLFWFAVGWLVPLAQLERFFKRYGGYVAIEYRDFKRAVTFFTKYEKIVIFTGRLMPGVRSVISIPAGCVRMSPKLFLLLSFLGALLWNTMLMLGGFFILDDFALVEKYMEPIANGIIYVFIGLYVFQVARFMYRRYHTEED
jgi:membrane protein DedA with SNARE-associated domain